MILRRTCKQVAALLIAREDRQIALSDRVAVRLHMMACDACPDFERQILLMRRVMRLWRDADDASAQADDGEGDGAR
jgi:hypothetical protein